MILLRIIFLCFTLLGLTSNAEDNSKWNITPTPKDLTKEVKEKIKHAEAKKRAPKYKYTYIDRTHTAKENFNHIAALYGVTWAIYPLTQPKAFKEKGSWKNYGNNFGEIGLDKDEPFWNWIVHPISGSQLYLYYRANGYSNIDSLAMTFVSSTLFEFTVEIYTERASIQDLYQTPVIGSIFGLGLETLSLYLLNTGNLLGKFFGHVLNPSTLFWFYEGKIRLIPKINGKDDVSALLQIDF